uniref:Uncharacterized protein n=1 Tax=Chromera velia CCMP2878 TaxID=1169474 RepID=A0A0G4G350_9ALVE|eukprot:Cvel_19904.t1-p1 / transcript=Cvel_19904.t1 / gene=Cvel_19904 / organism=Chromera_velia_CCMP2878 / gene_product=hypothetical protein / transcript_product=hypothetical protein / location=Cvel_scaffold1748:35575-36303(+) / protein_length=243 / sequence_SO=supercontig / SO=protein_coding / is_pseudo=false
MAPHVLSSILQSTEADPLRAGGRMKEQPKPSLLGERGTERPEDFPKASPSPVSGDGKGGGHSFANITYKPELTLLFSPPPLCRAHRRGGEAGNGRIDAHNMSRDHQQGTRQSSGRSSGEEGRGGKGDRHGGIEERRDGEREGTESDRISSCTLSESDFQANVQLSPSSESKNEMEKRKKEGVMWVAWLNCKGGQRGLQPCLCFKEFESEFDAADILFLPESYSSLKECRTAKGKKEGKNLSFH